MYDLSYGIRLPSPTFCPPPIAYLIKQCFYETPSKRPNFEQIKCSIEIAFDKLMNKASSSLKAKKNENVKTVDSFTINRITDNRMKSRYSLIKQGNIKERRYKKTTDAEVLMNDEGNASPTKYVSIEKGENMEEDTNRTIKNKNVHTAEDVTKRASDVKSKSPLHSPGNVKYTIDFETYSNLTKSEDVRDIPSETSLPVNLMSCLNLTKSKDVTNAYNFRSSPYLIPKNSANFISYPDLIKSTDTEQTYNLATYPYLFKFEHIKNSCNAVCSSQLTKLEDTMPASNFGSHPHFRQSLKTQNENRYKSCPHLVKSEDTKSIKPIGSHANLITSMDINIDGRSSSSSNRKSKDPISKNHSSPNTDLKKMEIIHKHYAVSCPHLNRRISCNHLIASK